jgi:hypothetical protein
MIIDHCEKFELDEDNCRRHANELRTIQYLKVGLDYLNHQVSQIEKKVADQFKNYKVLSYGNDPQLSWVPKDLISCSFHWYATSSCNYVWLVGWLAQKINPRQVAPMAYAKSVMPEVLLFRHKVAAHLALIFPKNDSPADLMASTIYPITYNDDAFYVGDFAITKKSSNKSSTGLQGVRWSLTRIHAQLAERYWPSNSGGKP